MTRGVAVAAGSTATINRLPRFDRAKILVGARRHAFLIVALLCWVAPVILSLADGYWQTAQGAQGPLILAIGAWALTWQYGQCVELARPGSMSLAITMLVVAAIVYVLAAMVGSVTIAFLAASGGLIAILYAYAGARMIRALWVPILFLLAMTPPPYLLALELTGALKLAIARWSVEVLNAAGYAVAFNGSALYIDQYELVVEAACSGLNSLFSLTAIGFLYIFFQRRGGWRWAAVLMIAVVPIAIVANLVRVLMLMVMVHTLGIDALRTALHPAAGFVMFAVALLLLVGMDTLGRVAGFDATRRA